jgi:uncharacterized protein (TIGR03790 family)
MPGKKSITSRHSLGGRVFFRTLFPFFLGFILLSGGTGFSLTADQVLVVANSRQPESVRLAEYYMDKRGIPATHLLKLALADQEVCTRETYDRDVVLPLRKYLKATGLESKIRCLVTMYGLPLKVRGPKKDGAQIKQFEILRDRKISLEKQMKELGENPGGKKSLESQLLVVEKELNALTLQANKGASFDSELALLLDDNYSLSGWVLNPFFLGFRGQKKDGMPGRVLMVSRLDAPSPRLVRRMVDDGLAVEKAGGLKGQACIDARYPRPDRMDRNRKKADLYKVYDQALYRAADLIRGTGVMPVVINEKPELFQTGECRDTALYSGWYSLSEYVDAFDWRPGAVGYHIASGECATLKKEGSQVWCKRMIEEGVAATLGPVDEPYLSAFPPPDLFFGLLIKGNWTLAECYALSQPFWSWKMVLIGDPLYRPFPRRHSTGPGF